MADPKPNVAALVAQMPDTDRQKLNPNDANAVNTGCKFTGPDPAEAQKSFAAILAGGRESILELLALLRDPSDDDFKDYKAGYVLHGLCLIAKDEQRRTLAEAMASQLKGAAHSPAAKRILIRQLQVAGGKEAVAALGESLADAELCDNAVQALLAIREGVAGSLRKALDMATGPNLAAVVQALGELQDRESLAAQRRLLSHEDPDVRRCAARALARLGDEESAPAILKLADTSTGWERTHATGLCHSLAEHLATAGKKDAAARIHTHLRDTRTDPEELHVKESAARALEALK